MQPGVEPLRAVWRRALRRQHVTHLVIIGLRIGLGGEIATLPAPIGPGPGKAVKHLLGAGLAAHRGPRCRLAPPQERGHTLFLDALHLGRHARLAEILLRDDIGRHLTPAAGHFAGLQLKDDRAIGITNLRRGQPEIQTRICILPDLGEIAFDPHGPVPLIAPSARRHFLVRLRFAHRCHLPATPATDPQAHTATSRGTPAARHDRPLFQAAADLVYALVAVPPYHYMLCSSRRPTQSAHLSLGGQCHFVTKS